MKAILVIDNMPNEAKIEEYRITYVVYHLQGCGKSVQGVGVSLRPLPKKKTTKYPIWADRSYEDFDKDYNVCLAEITGEEE